MGDEIDEISTITQDKMTWNSGRRRGTNAQSALTSQRRLALADLLVRLGVENQKNHKLHTDTHPKYNLTAIGKARMSPGSIGESYPPPSTPKTLALAREL
jgi:hypothetical protein